MRDVLQTAAQWAAEGRRFAVAAVASTWGSSPRPVGSLLLVREDGVSYGSVSGGCVEAEVATTALAVLRGDEPRRLAFEEVASEEVWRVGLSCGGRIEVEVFSGHAPGLWEEAWQRFSSRVGFSFLVSDGSLRLGSLQGDAGFAVRVPPADRLVIVGAVHIAVPLIRMAQEVGFEVVLIDPRRALIEADCFEASDFRLCEWPAKAIGRRADARDALDESHGGADSAMPGLIQLDEGTFCVLLSHDPKIDDPALEVMLRSHVPYVGALGSRTTHAQRCSRLAELGFSPDEISRIRGPIGLSIGAKTPAEIAVSILAEMIQVRRGG